MSTTERAAYPLASSRWTMAVAALIGLGAGLLVFALRTPVYEATAVVSVSPGSTGIAQSAVIDPSVIAAAASNLGFIPDVAMSEREQPGWLSITARSDDAAAAASAANAVATTLVSADPAVTIEDVADIPSRGAGASPLVFAGIGMLTGAILGATVSVWRRSRSRRTPKPMPELDMEPVSRLVPAQPVAQLAAHASDDVVIPLDTPAPSVFSTITEALERVSTPLVLVPELVLIGAPTPALLPDPLPVFVPVLATEPASEPEPEPEPEPAPQGLGAAEPTTKPSHFAELERRSLAARFESERTDLALAFDEQLAATAADYERRLIELRAENQTLQERLSASQVRRAAPDRVGDLEAQLAGVEIELAELRERFAAERISHAQRLADERDMADRVLDQARRDYRAELAKHLHSQRSTLSEQQAELDALLAVERAGHADDLEASRKEYERLLAGERAKAEAAADAAAERHEQALAEVVSQSERSVQRQAQHQRETIAALRNQTEQNSATIIAQLDQIRQSEAQLVQLRQQRQIERQEHDAAVQRLAGEAALLRTELEGERQRNAALRSDVLRRSAEAHQVIDRAVEERTAQLRELEASVARQRKYADARIREISAAAEDQAREGAAREAALNATISRLQRELDALHRSKG